VQAIIDTGLGQSEREHHQHPSIFDADSFCSFFGCPGLYHSWQHSGCDDRPTDSSGAVGGGAVGSGSLRYWNSPDQCLVLPGLDYLGDTYTGEPGVCDSLSDIHRDRCLAEFGDRQYLCFVRSDTCVGGDGCPFQSDSNPVSEPAAGDARLQFDTGCRPVYRDR